MPTKVVKLGDLAKEIKGFSKATIEAQKEAVASGMLRSIPDLVAASPVDTGEYANSWEFTELENAAVLGNFAPHAGIIENGARPFTPPIGPLLAWAKRVLNSPSQPPNYGSDVWGLARGVQNKITKNGMSPRRILEQAIPGIIENVKQEFSRLERG